MSVTTSCRTSKARLNGAATEFGIAIVDFRIRRTDLPDANAQSIYQRMRTEREREAKEFRAQGAEVAQRIRARAERERTVLIAESKKTAQIRRGEGDADAIRIYAESFGQDPEFFAFYRSMEAYRKRARQGEHDPCAEPRQRLLRLLRRHLRQGLEDRIGKLPAPARSMEDFALRRLPRRARPGAGAGRRRLAGRAPNPMRRFMLRLAGYSPAILRFCGLTAAMLGLAVVWAARRWV